MILLVLKSSGGLIDNGWLRRIWCPGCHEIQLDRAYEFADIMRAHTIMTMCREILLLMKWWRSLGEGYGCVYCFCAGGDMARVEESLEVGYS